MLGFWDGDTLLIYPGQSVIVIGGPNIDHDAGGGFDPTGPLGLTVIDNVLFPLETLGKWG